MLLLSPSCALNEVELRDRACPCTTGYTCGDEGLCVKSGVLGSEVTDPEAGDATPSDGGTPADDDVTAGDGDSAGSGGSGDGDVTPGDGSGDGDGDGDGDGGPLAACIRDRQTSSDECIACQCNNCLDPLDYCETAGGGMCDAVRECYVREMAAGNCGRDLTGVRNCYFSITNISGTGPCAALVDTAGGGAVAVAGGSCYLAATANVCSAVVAVGACTAANCSAVCECGEYIAEADCM